MATQPMPTQHASQQHAARQPLATPRDYRAEIELALAGGTPARVPFTMYDGLIPRGVDLAPLQARGLALCCRRGVCRKVMPNVKVSSVEEPGGVLRTVYETPLGTLTGRQRRSALAYTPIEHPIKRRDDYRVALFIANDARFEPDYGVFPAAEAKLGRAGKVIAHTCYEPLMEIQVQWVGQERFCYEVADHEDAVLELHAAIARAHRQMYDVVARGPAEWVLYGGNVVPDMLGPQRVRELIAPCWTAFGARLHEAGKKVGCHLDANNRLILDTVRDSGLDFVEAFTPPPDCNVSVAEARAAWPGKRLWLNFPSSVHLRDSAAIRAATRELLAQAGDRRGFLLGVTEDVPVEHLVRSYHAILDVLNE